jgi:hypothetical protein
VRSYANPMLLRTAADLLTIYGDTTRPNGSAETVVEQLRIAARRLTAYLELPRIVVLCGSTRFGSAFEDENLRLTLEGYIVLSVGAVTSSDAQLLKDGRITDRCKRSLDRLHLRKIDLADEVRVLNVGGYVGESTQNEIDYAESLGKPITYLEPVEVPA